MNLGAFIISGAYWRGKMMESESISCIIHILNGQVNIAGNVILYNSLEKGKKKKRKKKKDLKEEEDV